MNDNEQPSPSELEKAIEVVEQFENTMELDGITRIAFQKIKSAAKRVKALEEQRESFEHKIIELACKGTDASRFDSVAEMQVATLYKWRKEMEESIVELEQQLLNCKRETIKECARQSTFSAIKEKQFEIDKLEQQLRVKNELIERCVADIKRLLIGREDVPEFPGYKIASEIDFTDLRNLKHLLSLAHSQGYGKEKKQ